MRSYPCPVYAFVGVYVTTFTGKAVLQYMFAVMGATSLDNNTPRRQTGLYSPQQWILHGI